MNGRMDGWMNCLDGRTDELGCLNKQCDAEGEGFTYRSQIVEAILSGHLVGEFIVNALTEADQE